MKKILINAWTVEKKNDIYFLPLCHLLYLQVICLLFDHVVLLAPCCSIKDDNIEVSGESISHLKNVSVYELPYAGKGYIGQVLHFFSYVKGYFLIKDVTTYYSRFPTPFGWIPSIIMRKRNCIIHYVGDPADAARSNPFFSYWKKKILLAAFGIEEFLYRIASQRAKVFTNGHHMSDNLKAYGIKAIPLVSSTLSDSDYYYEDAKVFGSRFLYVGYLRTAKGIEVILEAFQLYQKDYPEATLRIVGSGEQETFLHDFVDERQIKNVSFAGNILCREALNKEYRNADIFLFGSYSEGSPRVVLEAMANGLVVISTPVGSLPTQFEDDYSIIYADFGDSQDFYKKMSICGNNLNHLEYIRKNSFLESQKYTLERFLHTIFDQND